VLLSPVIEEHFDAIGKVAKVVQISVSICRMPTLCVAAVNYYVVTWSR